MMKSPVWTIDAYYDFLGSLWKGHDRGWEGEREWEKKKKKCMYIHVYCRSLFSIKKKDEMQIKEAGILCWTAPSYAFENICIAGKTKIHNNKHFEIAILMMSSYFFYVFRRGSNLSPLKSIHPIFNWEFY